MRAFAITRATRELRLALAGLAIVGLAAGAAAQSVETVDPNRAIDADIAAPAAAAQAPGADYATPLGSEEGTIPALPADAPAPAQPAPAQPATPAAQAQGATYRKDDLIGAAEGVFGKGAKGLA